MTRIPTKKVSKMKNKTVHIVFGLLLALTSLCSVMPMSVHAQDIAGSDDELSLVESASQAASEAVGEIADTIDEITASESAAIENIKKVIEKNISTDKVKEAFVQVFRQKRGVIGQVTRVTENMITLSSADTTIIVSTTDATTIVEGTNELGVEDIAVDDWLSVVGFDDDGTFEPVEITVLEEDPYPQDVVTVIGSIETIEDNNITVVSRKNSNTIAFTITDSSRIEDATGKELTADELQEDLTCLVVAQKEDDDTAIKHLRLFISSTEIQDATQSAQ